jgi:transcription-repair coupling factor (superfamily II helicase)
MEQLPQPSFHKNFELLIEDIEEKQKRIRYLDFFSTEKQKERLESIFEELEHELPFKSFKSELHEGFVDNGHKLLVYTDHQIFDRYQRYKAKNTLPNLNSLL